MRVATLHRLCLLKVESCCHVSIIFDGINHHHSKRSTTKQKVDCHSLQIEYHYNRCRLLMVIEVARIAPLEEQEQLNEEINDVNKKKKSMEKKLSTEFVDVGENLILKVNEQKK
jgi:hypothetical protein